MKTALNILLFLLMLFSNVELVAQKDSIALKRNARKMVREGNALYQQEKYTDASVAYKKALNNSSSYDKASYNLGNALYQNKNFKEAVPQYELTAKTAEDKFTKAEAYHNIGNSMMETKNYQGAVDAYKNSLRNNPNDDETRYNLAVAQKLLDKENQDNKDNKDDKDNKDNKDKKDNKDQDQDKKEGEDKDKKDDKNKDGEGDKDKKENQDPKKDDDKNEKEKPKPQQGKMSPQQIKQLLESLNNEEKKTQKKLNAQKSKGEKIKQEKDW